MKDSTVEDILHEFQEQNLSPVVISKRQCFDYFENLYVHLCSTAEIEVMVASGHNGIVYCVQGKKRRIKNGLLDLDLMIECEHLLAPHKKALKEKTLEDLDYLRIRSDIYYKHVYSNYIEDFMEVQT